MHTAARVAQRRCCTGWQVSQRQVLHVLRSPTRAAAGSQKPPAAAVEAQWNDIVEYALPEPVKGAKLGIGRVDAVADGRVTLAPLEEDEDDNVWVESHDTESVVVSEASVLRILPYDFSQRQDKEGNPHGEHAHDVYTLLDSPSRGVYRGPRTVKVVIRSEGDQE